jgi:hypothetical protein
VYEHATYLLTRKNPRRKGEGEREGGEGGEDVKIN